MKIYTVTRDWVDRVLVGENVRVLVLPIMVPGFAMAFYRTVPVAILFWLWFAFWSAFVSWRWWIYMRAASAMADKKYDRIGKFRLAREYWNTESATAALNRKKKKHG